MLQLKSLCLKSLLTYLPFIVFCDLKILALDDEETNSHFGEKSWPNQLVKVVLADLNRFFDENTEKIKLKFAANTECLLIAIPLRSIALHDSIHAVNSRAAINGGKFNLCIF